MIVQEIYRNPDRLKHPFNYEQDGQETLNWLRFQWQMNRDRKARRAAEKLARKLAAWKRQKAKDIRDEKGRQDALKVLNRLERERYAA